MTHSLAQKLSRFKSGSLYMGVDLGLDQNEAKIMDEQARVVATIRFRHSRSDYEHLIERMAYYVGRHHASGIVVGMEPTNYFWILLATELERRQVDYFLVNAYTVRKHREGDQLDKAKDDPRDAFTIADLLRTGKYTQTRLLHDPYAELRQYVILHGRLQRDIGRQKTLLRTTVGQLFPELLSVFKDLTQATALAMLQRHAAAAVVRQMSQQAFIDTVRADFQGRRLLVGKLCRAHQLAADSLGVLSGLQALQSAVRVHLETLQLLQKQAASVRQALLQTFHAMPEAPYLLSLPGLGSLTAATIVAEIGDPRNYRNSRQLIKLAGIQPVPNRSGRKTRSATPMSRQGRPRLRTALYFACLRLIQINPDFAQDYHDLQHRSDNPLTKMQALGVLMNKLLRILWSLMRHQVSYRLANAQAS